MELELNREAMNRNWLLCVDSSLNSFEAFRVCCDRLINSPYDHLFLIALFEKPSKFLHTDDTYNSITLQHEDLCKKILSFYGHRAEALGIIFTMLGSGCSHIGKKICESTKQFNIVVGQESKKGGASICSYLMENCEASVFITKGMPDSHLSQKKLSLLIQNEKLIDIGCVSKSNSITPSTRPEVMEFFFYDIDTIAEEFKSEQKEMSKILEKELKTDLAQGGISTESKKKEGKTKWPKKNSIGSRRSSPFSQLDQMLIRSDEVKIFAPEIEQYSCRNISVHTKLLEPTYPNCTEENSASKLVTITREESLGTIKKKSIANRDKGKKGNSISEATV